MTVARRTCAGSQVCTGNPREAAADYEGGGGPDSETYPSSRALVMKAIHRDAAITPTHRRREKLPTSLACRGMETRPSHFTDIRNTTVWAIRARKMSTILI